MRWLWIVLGLVLVLVGGMWTLQGLDILGGSAMSGDTTWAIIGPVVLVVGLLTLMVGSRRRT